MADIRAFGQSAIHRLGHLGRLRSSTVRRARFGLAFGPAHATLVCVERDDALLPPRLLYTQRVEVESGRRVDLARRWLQAGPLRDAVGVVVLAPGEYDTLQLPAPAVPADELRDALRWQLRGTLPYSPEEAAIDYVHLPQPADAPPRPTLFVVAAPKSTVAHAVAPLRELGVEVQAVDIPEFAQRNLDALFGPGPTPHHGGTAAGSAGSSAWLGFEANACLLTVHCGGELTFARRIPITDHGATSDTENLIAYLTDRVTTQVQRTLDLYERQSSQPAVNRLLLSPHRHAHRFARELAARNPIEARVFDPMEALRAGDDGVGTAPWTHDHVWALGAALHDRRTAAAAGGLPGWLDRLRRPAAAH